MIKKQVKCFLLFHFQLSRQNIHTLFCCLSRCHLNSLIKTQKVCCIRSQVLWNLFKREMRNVLISVSKDVIFFLKNDHGLCSGHQCHYRQLNHEKAHYSKIFKKHKVSSYSKKRKERKRKRPAKFQNRNRFGLRWREKGKKKTRTHCIKCTLKHIANLVLHVGMKPFPLKC